VPPKTIMTVTELNTTLKQIFDELPFLDGITIKGELSNYKVYPSGHHYFSVKDAESQLRCVMFKGAASTLRFKPENGMKVLLNGRVQVYPRDGAYQLYVSRITPEGAGDLHVAFEQLKQRLSGEGLFDAARKKRLPRYPRKIAIITSSAGAAVRDILRILRSRYPIAEVCILPVRVQGVEAPPEIVAAIAYANQWNVADLIITGRGGGSIEDLWAFNDERVAYAIANSRIPVISAVGHEPDVTIADYVADVRAATPSNAAEIAVPDMQELFAMLNNAKSGMINSLRRATDLRREHLKRLQSSSVMSSPTAYIDEKRQMLDYLSTRLCSAAKRIIDLSGNRFVRLASALDAMSPLKVLSRGYSLTYKDGKALKSVKQVAGGDKLKLRLSDGEIGVIAE